MSGADRVNSFNPILIVIWLTQLLFLYLDWQFWPPVGGLKWSIPIVGSFFIIQLYMIWKTNYDEMMEERRRKQAELLGGPIDTPMVDPSSTELKDVYKSYENNSEIKQDTRRRMNINPSKKEEE